MKPWTNYYKQLELEEKLEYNSNATLLADIENALESGGDKVAFESEGQCQTFNELDLFSAKLATFLSDILELKKGDRVAVMLPNIMAFPVCLCGVLRAQLIQVNVNPRYTAFELLHQLKDSGAKVIIAHQESLDIVNQVFENSPIETVIAVQSNLDRKSKNLLPGQIEFRDIILGESNSNFVKTVVSPEDLAFLQYTGGTTGLSKGAMLSHGNIAANIRQFCAIYGDDLKTPGSTTLTALPLYHIFALTVNCLCSLVAGTRNILISDPSDMPKLIQQFANNDITMFTGVNTLFNGMVNTPGIEKIDFSALKVCIGGGAPVQEAISDKWKALTGQHITEGYGLSETSPVVTLNVIDSETFLSSIGIPLPETDVSIRDDDGREVSPWQSRRALCKRTSSYARVLGK